MLVHAVTGAMSGVVGSPSAIGDQAGSGTSGLFNWNLGQAFIEKTGATLYFTDYNNRRL